MKARNGFEYEDVVLNAIKTAGISGLIANTAGSNPNVPDADFKIQNNVYNLEIKLDEFAQMGGSSITFDKSTRKFGLVTSTSSNIEEILLQAVSTKEHELVQLIDCITYEERNLAISQKFPLMCSKDTWETAQKKNHLVNVKVPCSIEFLKNHLFKKNVHYIQIGGKGLYHVGLNPAKLPVEELQGEFTVEIRTGRSGSKPSPKGFSVVTGAIRVQGRLNISNLQSKYTLDDPLSIVELLEDTKTGYYDYTKISSW